MRTLLFANCHVMVGGGILAKISDAGCLLGAKNRLELVTVRENSWVSQETKLPSGQKVDKAVVAQQ